MLSSKLGVYQSSNNIEGLYEIIDELLLLITCDKSQMYIDNINYVIDLINKSVNDDDMVLLDEAIEILFNIDL